MIVLMAVIFLVVTGGPVRAQEDSPPTAPPATPLETPAEINAETAPETAPEIITPKSSAEDVVWPPPFNPSEEIGADSQVSFPTDI